MKRKWQIILVSSSFALGVVFAANYKVSIGMFWLGVLAGVSLLSLLYVKSKLGYILLMIIGLMLGILRFEIHTAGMLASSQVFADQKVTVVGRVSGEPRWDEYRNYVFYLSDVRVNGSKVEGLVRIKTITGNVQEGQIVRADGKLKYGQGKADTYISYAKVDVLDGAQPLSVQIKNVFTQGLYNSLPDESAAFVSGILIGSRSALPSTHTNLLTVLGLSHIVAVSGYNLTILIGFLNRRISKNWRWGGLVASLWIILGFVIISGASASILRAGIMSAIFLIANHYGRRLNLVVCLCLAGTVMVMAQPQSLLSDLGWQLSFLSLLGITILAPRISRLLPSKPKIINDILSVTLAAQISTAGFVVYKFGQLSVLAPLSNLMVIPLMPILMLLGVLAAIIGILFPQFAYIYFGKFIHSVVTTLFDFLSYLSGWQISVLKFENPKLSLVIVYYAALIIFAIAVRSREDYSFIGINHDRISTDDNLTKGIKVKGELSVRS